MRPINSLYILTACRPPMFENVSSRASWRRRASTNWWMINHAKCRTWIIRARSTFRSEHSRTADIAMSVR